LESIEEFSLYGIANARAKIPLGRPLQVIQINVHERVELVAVRHLTINESAAIELSRKILGSQKIIIYWSATRGEWVAFRVIDIPTDMSYDRTNYSYAYALDMFTKTMLAETFGVQGVAVWREPLQRMSPTQLQALGKGPRSFVHKPKEIKAESVQRFVELRERLSSAEFKIASFPFRGWDKFKKNGFKYTLQHVKPPRNLFWTGADWQVLNTQTTVSFGGTVSPTADGFQLSELLAQRAVDHHGAVVVSGGVIGIDMAAHLGALDQNGKTVAVLANPVVMGLHPYEPRRSFLENEILKHEGLLVSEHDTPSEDREERLLQRDRIITALSDVFIAVECSKDSATVDTAKRAKIQGKKVFAIDWSRIRKKGNEPKTGGTRQLLEEKIADALPSGPVDDIRARRLLEEFSVMLGRTAPAS